MESKRGYGCVTIIVAWVLIFGGGFWSAAHYWY